MAKWNERNDPYGAKRIERAMFLLGLGLLLAVTIASFYIAGM